MSYFFLLGEQIVGYPPNSGGQSISVKGVKEKCEVLWYILMKLIMSTIQLRRSTVLGKQNKKLIIVILFLCVHSI